MKLLLLTFWSFFVSPQWATLVNGPHAVGYQTLNRYDYGRSTMPPVNFEGKKNEGERAIPMQISLWYPTDAKSGDKVRFEDYVYRTKERHDLKPLTNEQMAQAIDVLKFSAREFEITDDQVREIYKQPMLAIKDAPAKTGKFPVIIVASDGGPSNAPALYEHLASLGYIVLFTPSTMRDATRQVNAPQHVIIDRISNIEYLLEFGRTLPNADMEKVGLLGVNFDGMTTMLYQMKSGEARAVVSIDGWEGKVGSEKTVQNSMYYNPISFKVPYFVVLQDEKDPPAYLSLSENIYNSLMYSDRYYYVFKNINHGYLISSLYQVPMIPTENRQSYNYLFTSIGKFFDAYIKGDANAKQFINKTSKENDLPDLAKIELMKTALPAIPSASELETMIMAEEFDKVKKIAIEAMKGNPSLKFIDASALDLYNFRFSRANKPKSCVAVRELGVIVFPQSAQAMDALGDAQSAASQKNDAVKSYKHALSLIATDPNLDDDDKKSLTKSISEKVK